MTGPQRDKPLLYLLTPRAPAGISVLLLEGAGAGPLLARRFKASRERAGKLPSTGRAAHGYLFDEGEALDEILLVGVREDPPAFEICCHGGSAATDAVVRSLTRAGAEVRAWSDRLTRGTLTHDVCSALFQSRGRQQAALLAFQDHQGLRARLSALADQLRGRTTTGDARDAGREEELPAWFHELEASHRLGRYLVDPPRIVLTGPPNAGKSTLFNTLLRDQRALTSPIPGTTLDPVEATLIFHGLPLTMIDLPGLGPPPSSVLAARAEAQAVKHLDSADLKIHLQALPQDEDFDAPRIDLDSIEADARGTLVAFNKIDRIKSLCIQTLRHDLRSKGIDPVFISARTGAGTEDLLERIDDALGMAELRDGFKPICFNKQQLDLFNAIKIGWKCIKKSTPLEDRIEAYLEKTDLL